MRLGFRRLQTRLTVLYAVLFATVMIVLAFALQLVVFATAEQAVGGQLKSSGAVFQQLLGLEAARLVQGGQVTAQDFGFRQAVATGDIATTQSALDNLKDRLNADRAMILKPDGSLIGGHWEAGLDPHALSAALDPQTTSSGVLMLNGRAFIGVAAPILAPDPQGWLLFAQPLGRSELAALEHTASIPIKAEIAQAVAVHGRLGGLVRGALGGGPVAPTRMVLDGAAAEVLVQRLNGLGGGPGAGLVLSYPLAEAMAPYRHLRLIVSIAGIFGGVLLVLGGWFVSRGVTRPVRALDEAVKALREGRSADIAIHGRDELSRLATSFNEMALTIREREASITQLAYSNAETGLGNARALGRDVANLLQACPGTVAVAVLAIDRFAYVRGAIGYVLAQRLVSLVGERLGQLGCVDVARLTSSTVGFAFASRSEDEARARLENLVCAMRAAFPLADTVVDITLTAGFTLSSEAKEGAEILIERASIALEQAAASLSRIAIYDSAAYGDPARNLSLMSELMSAMDSDQFSLAYQPKHDFRRRRVTGVEALARWRHPTRGPLSPDLFVTMAEETGHIREMTDWVLVRSIADQARLASIGHAINMSVNLSGRLLADDEFMTAALQRLADRRGGFCLEITETAVINNPERAECNMQRIADAGVELSIDDYGSGLSSLAYLQNIRAQELKIDKTIVLQMDTSSKSALLVRSTVDMGHSLGLNVTAEGVETATTFALLSAMGCDLAQGYHIAKPMPLSALEDFLAAQQRRAEDDGQVQEDGLGGPYPGAPFTGRLHLAS